MTNKEAIARIKNHMEIHQRKEPQAIYITEALGIAIKALEQEPKTGHWIFTDECHEHGRCSECGFGEVDLMMGSHDYCRRCGAKMVSCRSADQEGEQT